MSVEWPDEDDDFDITSIKSLLDQQQPAQGIPASATILPARSSTSSEYEGFDGITGISWIYPSNLPKRAYQYNIASKALFSNTLVVLPTGLGKTFIAAVVMYNIYRWYPQGKVIFMAPTRPLVSQQIAACQQIMPFPDADTVELTGKLSRTKRGELWTTKRVFFATPQVVHSDILENKEFPFMAIKLLVVDEAHRAKGRYAYTLVTDAIIARNSNFRMLALSATPGRTVEDVATICTNLYISHLEVRCDNSIDVMPYIHQRSMQTIVVPLGDRLREPHMRISQIIDPYLRQLKNAEVLSGGMSKLSRNFLLFEQKRFQEHEAKTQRHPDHNAISQNFSMSISLTHSLELLERHGLRVFVNSFEQDEDGQIKFVLMRDAQLRELVEEFRQKLGPNPLDMSTHNMTNGKMAPMPKELDFGHPKYIHTRQALLTHFQSNPNSRAIVFCEYRESVILIQRLLLQNSPLLRPRCFVGQGGSKGSIRALTQKQQLQIMADFRAGISNVLVATSIGEEGIDVGEVELIVCFDICTSNPIRFIQRIGRTGRQKRGHVVMLATEGREEQQLKEVLASKDHINRKLMQSPVLKRALYTKSPRLVPPEVHPTCIEKFIEPPPPVVVVPRNNKKKTSALVANCSDLRTFFGRSLQKPSEPQSLSQTEVQRLRKVNQILEDGKLIQTSDDFVAQLQDKQLPKCVKICILRGNADFARNICTKWQQQKILNESTRRLNSRQQRTKQLYQLFVDICDGSSEELERHLKVKPTRGSLGFQNTPIRINQDIQLESVYKDIFKGFDELGLCADSYRLWSSNVPEEDSTPPSSPSPVPSPVCNYSEQTKDPEHVSNNIDNFEHGCAYSEVIKQSPKPLNYSLETVSKKKEENGSSLVVKLNTLNNLISKQSTKKETTLNDTEENSRDSMLEMVDGYLAKLEEHVQEEKSAIKKQAQEEERLAIKALNVLDLDLSDFQEPMVEEQRLITEQTLNQVKNDNENHMDSNRISPDLFEDDDFDFFSHIKPRKVPEASNPGPTLASSSVLMSPKSSIPTDFINRKVAPTDFNECINEEDILTKQPNFLSDKENCTEYSNRLHLPLHENQCRISPDVFADLSWSTNWSQIPLQQQKCLQSSTNITKSDFKDEVPSTQFFSDESVPPVTQIPNMKHSYEVNSGQEKDSPKELKNLFDDGNFNGNEKEHLTQFILGSDNHIPDDKIQQLPKKICKLKMIYKPKSPNFPLQSEKCISTPLSIHKPRGMLDQSRKLLQQHLDHLQETPILRCRNKRKIIHSDSDETVAETQIVTALDSVDSDTDFNQSINQQKKSSAISKNREVRAFHSKRRKPNKFILDEAEHSGSNNDEAENETKLTESLKDFVVISSDDDVANDTNVHGMYLQMNRNHIQDPPGAFKIPAPSHHYNVSHIYSQPVELEQSQYLACSFINDEETLSEEEQSLEECPLERAERILKEKRRQKRRQSQRLRKDVPNASMVSGPHQGKRRRIQLISSSSSDDDIS